MDANKIEELQEKIGELLAGGYADVDIVASLEVEEKLSHEEACEALHAIYKNWQRTRDVLALKEDSLVDWHVYLRRKILQNAIAEGTVPSLRLALSVLDSLATIQGIVGAQGQTVPLAITLIEKREVPNDTESENASEFHQRGVEGPTERMLDETNTGAAKES